MAFWLFGHIFDYVHGFVIKCCIYYVRLEVTHRNGVGLQVLLALVRRDGALHGHDHLRPLQRKWLKNLLLL